MRDVDVYVCDRQKRLSAAVCDMKDDLEMIV